MFIPNTGLVHIIRIKGERRKDWRERRMKERGVGKRKEGEGGRKRKLKGRRRAEGGGRKRIRKIQPTNLFNLLSHAYSY